MRRDQLLLLEFPDFSERMSEFLRELEQNPSLQQLYIRDPGGVLSRSVFKDQPAPPTSALNQGNRLLFALLSNPGFMAWADEYGERLSARALKQFPELDPDQAARAHAATLRPDEVYSDLIDAALKNIDRELLAALIVVDVDDVESVISPRAGISGTQTVAWSPVFVVVFVVVAAVIAAVVLNHHVARAAPAGFSRQDLGRLSRLLTESLKEHADELRRAGVLSSPESARRGSDL